MGIKIRYSLYTVVIVILVTIIPKFYTNSKYISSIDIKNNVPVGIMSFKIEKDDGEPDVYYVQKGNQVTLKYKLINIDENNHINQMEMKYYVKIVDSNDIELPFDILIEGYDYIEENIEGSSQKNRKGFGEINLAYDGQTIDTKNLNIIISCPKEYSGYLDLNCKLKIIAEGIYNPDLKYTESVDFALNIEEGEQDQNQLQQSTAKSSSQSLKYESNEMNVDNQPKNENVIDENEINQKIEINNIKEDSPVNNQQDLEE